jgi:uncharacterized protein
MTLKNELGRNHLKKETSKYLIQHAQNPVHWWPFGPEAFNEAKILDKPIFLSIGYSTCHWCHVMEKESFESPEVANLLNTNFINIKVDREEHPEVDRYFQKLCQLFNQGRSGWPLSAFILNDLSPIYVGTYFPHPGRGEGLSFVDLISNIINSVQYEKDKIINQAQEFQKSLDKEKTVSKEHAKMINNFAHPNQIFKAISEGLDQKHGGFLPAPKFMYFPFINWAIDQAFEGLIDKANTQFIVKSIENMLMGGVFDQARGGIHRYSTDEEWLVPHFEKMLYDQSGLLRVLSKSMLLTQSPVIYEALNSTLDYLSAEMIGDQGYFFSAQDADSEDQEGLYFTFTEEEFTEYIKNTDVDISKSDESIEKYKSWFGMQPNGNFSNGLNVIHINQNFKEDVIKNWDIFLKLKKVLLNARKDRIPPLTDNKGLASWNFLLLSSLADVFQYCPVPEICLKAKKIAEGQVKNILNTFIKYQVDQSDVEVYHSTTKILPYYYFEDYATLSELLIRLYELSADNFLKELLEKTLHFTFEQFIEGDLIYSTNKDSNEAQLIAPQVSNPFDQGFESPVGTFILTAQRASVLFSNKDFMDKTRGIRENVLNAVLQNPIMSGKVLHSITYPDDAFRVLKLPKKWLMDPKFLQMKKYFTMRFVFDYHSEEGEFWEVCNINECQYKGEGQEEFFNLFIKNSSEQENKK